METLADAIVELTAAEAGGFKYNDTSRPASLLNEGIKRVASVSEWVKAQLELGPTVVGQEEYELPKNVIHLEGVMVAGNAYDRIDYTDFWDLMAGRASLASETAGAYCERFSPDGKIKRFALWQVPDVVAAILGIATIYPEDLEPDDLLPYPPDVNRAIVDYAKGIAYEDLDENPAAGEHFLSRCQGLGEGLRTRGRSHTGRGPFKVRVAGHSR